MKKRYVVVLDAGNKPWRALAAFDELAEAEKFARQNEGASGPMQFSDAPMTPNRAPVSGTLQRGRETQSIAGSSAGNQTNIHN